MTHEIVGLIKVIGNEQQVSDKFKKRDVVITEDGGNPEYPQHISFQLTQAKTDLLNSLKVGDKVIAKYNLRGKEWNGVGSETKYFNTLEIWQIKKVEAGTSVEQAAPQIQEPQHIGANDESDDLPF